MAQPRGKPVSYGVIIELSWTPHRAFPYRRNAPSHIKKSGNSSFVVLLVAINFVPPEVSAGRRHFEQRTVMPVPEAPVYKHNRIESRQHNIRFSWQFPDMKSVAKSTSVQQFPDTYLWFSILP
jgi:hypothetical protein